MSSKVKGIAAGAVAAMFLAGIVSCDVEDPGEPSSKPAASSSSEKKENRENKRSALSQAEQFKQFVRKSGSAAEQEAVAHVTKVQGADKQNDLLDSVSVFTDLEGGLASEGQGSARLIASSFADWKQSENGLVTVYGSDGEMITTGQF